jgi:hypothetical protein
MKENKIPAVTYAGYGNNDQVEAVLIYEGKHYRVWVEDQGIVETLYFPDEETMPEWFLTINDYDLELLIEEISNRLDK